MRTANGVLLFYATFLIEPAIAAVRLDILHPRHQRFLLQSNSTLKNVRESLSSTKTADTRTTLSGSIDLPTKHDRLSISETTSVPTTYAATGGPPSSLVSSSISFLPPTAFITSIEVDDLKSNTLPPTTENTYKTKEPSQVSTLILNSTTTWSNGSSSSLVACGNIYASNCSSAFPKTSSKLYIFPTNSSSLLTATSIESCTPLPSDRAVTEYSIVYTSTITFYGNSTDYTPPYSPITTPDYCSPPGEALITFYSTSRISNSTATATITVAASSTASPSFDFDVPALAPAPTFSINLPEIITQTPDAAGKNGGGIIITMRPFLSFTRRIITFITTDKNPSVVFLPEPTPDFSPTWITGGLGEGGHKTIEVIDNPQTNTRISNLLESVKHSPAPTFQLTAGGDQVIINDKTVSGLKPGQTTTITVGTEVFTIFPTAVVGLGSTITKPAPTGVSTPTPTVTSGVLGGVPVIISGTKVVVDGTTLSISSQISTTTINGRKVVFGTGTIAVDRETLIFQDPSPQPTHEIVTGGEMLTAIGSSIVVLNSTTITYGAEIAPDQTIINGETISIGPRGVSFHGTTLGGPSANTTNTEYEIVGGITVGKLSSSLVVVNGATYSINQDNDPTNFETTVIDNQTITIGPSGLILSSQTLTYPGTSITATLLPSKAPVPDFPIETGSQGDYEDDNANGAFSTRLDFGVMCVCLAISVWIIT